jgi:hypothetical protein
LGGLAAAAGFYAESWPVFVASFAVAFAIDAVVTYKFNRLVPVGQPSANSAG